MINQSELKELLHYDQESGAFTWLKSYRDTVTGKLAGTNGRNGYIDIKIKGVRYYAHRLAWLYVTGQFPLEVIDHIDRNKTNNCFANLRDVSRKENTNNQVDAQVNNATGIRGVLPYINGYSAQIAVNGKSKHLGIFNNSEDARFAYLSAKEIYAPLPKRKD